MTTKSVKLFVTRTIRGGGISKAKISLLTTFMCACNMLVAQIIAPAWIPSFSNLHTNTHTANVGIGTAFPACWLEVWKSSANTAYPDISHLGLFSHNNIGFKAETVLHFETAKRNRTT